MAQEKLDCFNPDHFEVIHKAITNSLLDHLEYEVKQANKIPPQANSTPQEQQRANLVQPLLTQELTILKGQLDKGKKEIFAEIAKLEENSSFSSNLLEIYIKNLIKNNNMARQHLPQILDKLPGQNLEDIANVNTRNKEHNILKEVEQKNEVDFDALATKTKEWCKETPQDLTPLIKCTTNQTLIRAIAELLSEKEKNVGTAIAPPQEKTNKLYDKKKVFHQPLSEEKLKQSLADGHTPAAALLVEQWTQAFTNNAGNHISVSKCRFSFKGYDENKLNRAEQLFNEDKQLTQLNGLAPVSFKETYLELAVWSEIRSVVKDAYNAGMGLDHLFTEKDSTLPYILEKTFSTIMNSIKEHTPHPNFQPDFFCELIKDKSTILKNALEDTLPQDKIHLPPTAEEKSKIDDYARNVTKYLFRESDIDVDLFPAPEPPDWRPEKPASYEDVTTLPEYEENAPPSPKYQEKEKETEQIEEKQNTETSKPSPKMEKTGDSPRAHSSKSSSQERGGH